MSKVTQKQKLNLWCRGQEMKGWYDLSFSRTYAACTRTVSWCSLADMEASQDGPGKEMVAWK